MQGVGADEHAWRHTRRGDRFVTLIVDLTAIHAGIGPARLVDMVESRSKLEATWGIYQRMITAYREADRTRGWQFMTALIESLSRGVPAALTELVTLGRP